MKLAHFYSFLILTLLFVEAQGQIDSQACRRTSNKGYVVKHFDNSTTPITLIDEKTAVALFNELKNPSLKIPYLNAQNGCDARAHKVAHYLNLRHGLHSVKVQIETTDDETGNAGINGAAFLSGTRSSQYLTHTSALTGEEYSWGYHMATALCVRTRNGQDTLFVFDHALFDRPVPYSAWKQELTKGLVAQDFREFSAGMHNLMIRTNGGHQNKAAFDSNDLSIMNLQLSRDWAHHQALLRSLSGRRRGGNGSAWMN